METFLQILPYLFGTSSVVSVILFIIFYKQNKALKNHEVEKSETEVEGGKIQNDMLQMDMGDRYLKGIIEASEVIGKYQSALTEFQTANKSNMEDITTDLQEIKNDLKSIKKEQSLMSLYLNGKYEEFKSHINQITEK